MTSTPEQLAEAVAKIVAYDFNTDDSLLCLVPSDLRQIQQVIRQLWAERAQLHKRLETVFVDGTEVESADGIACRDETIKALEKQLTAQRAVMGQAREALVNINNGARFNVAEVDAALAALNEALGRV